MRNITENIKNAISAEVLWGVSEFFYLIECLEKNNLKVFFSIEDDEECATVLCDDILIGYIWKKSPLMFIRRDYVKILESILDEFKYVELIEAENLNTDIFCLDMDEGLENRIRFLFNQEGFTANDFWFYNVR